MNSNDLVICTESLSKSFGEVHAFKSLTLVVTFAISLKLKGLKVALISTAVALIVAALLYVAAIFMITNSI